MPPMTSDFTIKTIQFKYQRKIALAKYESADLEASAWADVPFDSDPNRAMQELAIFIRQNLLAQATPLLIGRDKNIEPDLNAAWSDIETLTGLNNRNQVRLEEYKYKLMLIYRELAEKGMVSEFAQEFDAQFPDIFPIAAENLNSAIDIEEQILQDLKAEKAKPEVSDEQPDVPFP